MPKLHTKTAKLPGEPAAPKQRRSKEKLERIINAAFTVAAEEGFDATTLAKIATRASIATSTVYTRFKDKEALLHALHETATERSRSEIAKAFNSEVLRDLPLTSVLANIIERSLLLTEEMAGFQKACYQRALSDPSFAAREAKTRHELLQKTRELFETRKDEIGHPQIDVATQFFVTLYTSVITEHVMTKTFPADTLDNQQIAHELHTACVNYLQVGEAKT